MQGVFNLLQEVRQFSQDFLWPVLKEGCLLSWLFAWKRRSCAGVLSYQNSVVLQYLARICLSAGIPHSCPRCLNSTAAVTTRLHCLNCWKLLLLTWMEKLTHRLVTGLAALALASVFWLCFWPLTWNKQGKRLGSSLILKHSKRVTGVMKSNICARSDNPFQPLLPAQADSQDLKAMTQGFNVVEQSPAYSQKPEPPDSNVTVLCTEQSTRNAVTAQICLWVCF